MKNLTILGSTGSIGTNALRIVDQFPDRFRVKALAAKSSVAALTEQIRRYRPELAVVYDETTASELQRRLPGDSRVRVVCGTEGYREAAQYPSTDLVLAAMVGAAGLTPVLEALDAGKDIALANKETLVMAGELVTRRAAERGKRLLPVDSEHSAIFQCMEGRRPAEIDRIYLTASGGPFLDRQAADFSTLTPRDALQHPNWRMGPKISIDSATLMNKGLEVIEAKHLFNMGLDRIEVVIHPQSIIHSMVGFTDGSILAQLGIPDMRGAIAYGLSYPERLPLNIEKPDFSALGSLQFQKPDLSRFPCLELAYEASRGEGTLPAVLNASNEVAVALFLDGRLAFDQIPSIISKTMTAHRTVRHPGLSEILDADRWAREHTRGIAADRGGVVK